MELVMRKFGFGFLLMTISLALVPFASIAGQAGAPPTATEKAPIEAAAVQAAPPQDIKPAPATAAKPAALPSGSAGATPAKKAPVMRTEPIIPAFQTPKEKTAVIVFYVWLWLSIGVLIYFLRWWVQEADRVYRAKFYEPVESPRKDNPLPPLLGE
jgi:hypothetical protein